MASFQILSLYYDYPRHFVSLKCPKCWGSNLGNHKKCNDPCIWLLPTSVLCDLWLYFVLLLRRKSFRCPIRTTWRKRSRNTAKIFVNSSLESFCPNMKNMGQYVSSAGDLVSDMTMPHFYLESQSQSIRIDDVVAYSFQLFTASTESSSLLVCLLCHLLSLCVVVFSLPPSFTCLLLPFTCTPATSSVVSIHTARQSHVSSR